LPIEVAGEAIGIVATTGAGQSYTSAVLVEELWRAKVQFAVLDPTGAYWGLRASADAPSEGLPIIVLCGAPGDVPPELPAGPLITQRSAALNKNVLDLVETLLAIRMLGPRDRDAVKGWISAKSLSDELGVIDSLPSLPTGTAWAWSPVRGILSKIAMRHIGTF